MSPVVNQHAIVSPFAKELGKKNLPAPLTPSKSKEKNGRKKRRKIDSPSLPPFCPSIRSACSI